MKKKSKNKFTQNTRIISGETGFEYDLLNQTSRYKSNIFTVERNSDVLVKISYRSFPKSFREFTIVATVLLNETNGGYLFSIMNPLGTVVQLGLILAPTNRYIYNITLISTDAKLHLDSQSLAVFQVPAFKDETTIAIKVFLHKVTLYLNCHEVKTIVVNNDPVEIKTDTDSRLYVGYGGPRLQQKFEVNTENFLLQSSVICFVRIKLLIFILKGQISSLKIYSDPDAIGKICFGQVLVSIPCAFVQKLN